MVDQVAGYFELDKLLPTGSEEREVLGGGSIIGAINPSCQYIKLLHHNCIDMNIIILVVKIRNASTRYFHTASSVFLILVFLLENRLVCVETTFNY